MIRPVKRQPKPSGILGAELENNFVIRLPKPQAELLKEALRQGLTNVKDRLSIQLDFTNDKDDIRNGIITFDTIMYKARLMDLPTILEGWKTIDGKNFYKTADICQMLTVREGEDPPEDEDTKKKKKDPHKVDKKYLYPHGYTPPLKNVRKRRFRKTLKKKNFDLPELEKEVKRLLRADNEAVSIKWEVVREEEDKKGNTDTNLSASNLDEQLFGEVVSSSDDEVGATINIIDEDEDSRLSVDDSQFSESNPNESINSPKAQRSHSDNRLVTEFSSSMFKSDSDTSIKPSPPKSREKLYSQLSYLDKEITLLLSQRVAQEAEIASLENMALKQRFLSKLAEIDKQIREKRAEIHDIKMQL